MSDDKPTLEFTGERFTPECVREIAYEHWHRYAWALPWVQGRDVLDVACGEGYGTHLISERAKSVVGVDLDPETIEHAKVKYTQANVSFEMGDVLSLPLQDDCVDVVVCFETIEHVADHTGLMMEFKRVLRPDGLLLLSSPDKASYSDQTGYDNPFHVKELYREELDALLKAHFKSHKLWAQKLVFASSIWPLPGETHELSSPSIEWVMKDAQRMESGVSPKHVPQYYLAVASLSGRGLEDTNTTSLFTDKEESVYQHYNEEIQHHMQSAERLAEKDREIERLEDQLSQVSLQMPWWRRLFGRQD